MAKAVRRRFVAVDHPGWIQAHASTVLPVAGGLLVAWFAGTREGTTDNKIWLSSGSPEGPWSEPRVVMEGEAACWNPVLARGTDQTLWLFAKQGEKISQWRTWVCRSSDEGATWSAPELLVADDVGGRGPVKNPPIHHPDGVWLAPASTERWEGTPIWESFVDRSLDGGRTWQAVPIPLERSTLSGAGLIQPALWRDERTLHALMRSTEGLAYRTTSTDAGVSWSTAEPTDLANNNSGLTAVTLAPGVVACVHNPVGSSWGVRCPLVVSISHDAGHTWRRAVTIEDGRTPIEADPRLQPSRPSDAAHFLPADDGVATSGVGEYSYPAAAVNDDHLIVTYTWQRRGIAEAAVPLDLLI